MRRRQWLGLILALGACRQAHPPADLFAGMVAGGWHRTGLTNSPASESPDPVPRSAIEWMQIATYEGPGSAAEPGAPGKLEARAYALDSPAVASELAQRWRPSADTVFFYRDRYFVVVKWQAANRQALEAFVRDIETRLEKLTKAS
jgi:hypothetical protein